MAEEPIYAVMTPLQNDGLADWIDPDFQVWFSRLDEARAWARKWAARHEGTAIVFRCVPLFKIASSEEPKIIETEHESLRSESKRSLLEMFQELQGLDLEEFRRDVDSWLDQDSEPRIGDDNGTT